MTGALNVGRARGGRVGRLPHVGGLAWLWVLVFLIMPATLAAAERPVGRAMQFGITSYLRLSDFNGGTIAYQSNLSPDAAWRLGATVNVSDSRGDESFIYIDGEDTEASGDETVRSCDLALTCQWLRYRGDVLSVYFGGGPRLSFTYSRSEGYTFQTWTQYERHYWSRTFGVGLEGCLGVQWTATDWLAIHAEYVTRLTYQHTNVEEDEWSLEGDEEHVKRTTSVDAFEFDSTGVRFGVSVYF